MNYNFKERVGISVGLKLKDTMDVFVKNGIKYLEFRADATNFDPEETQKMKDKVALAISEKEKHGMNIWTAHLPFKPNYDMSVTDEEARLKAVELQKQSIELMAPLNLKYVVLHSNAGSVEDDQKQARRDALKKSLADFAPFCKKYGISVALENLIPCCITRTSAELLDVIEAVDADNIGVCFDVNHLFLESHSDFIKNVGKYILTMHTTDNDGKEEKHWLPGDGVIDWKQLFADLSEFNYDSTMICECGQVLSGFPDMVPVLAEKWKALPRP